MKFRDISAGLFLGWGVLTFGSNFEHEKQPEEDISGYIRARKRCSFSVMAKLQFLHSLHDAHWSVMSIFLFNISYCSISSLANVKEEIEQ